jgi:hypothetical protein
MEELAGAGSGIEQEVLGPRCPKEAMRPIILFPLDFRSEIAHGAHQLDAVAADPGKGLADGIGGIDGNA